MWFNPKVTGVRRIGGDTQRRRAQLVLTAETDEQLRERHDCDAALIRACKAEAAPSPLPGMPFSI